MAQLSKFDVEDALPRLVDALPRPPIPHSIPIVVLGGEVHEHGVPVPPVPPMPEPQGPQVPGVRDSRQQIQDSQIQLPLSDADLPRALEEFREEDRRRIYGGDHTSQVMDNFNRRQGIIISELDAEYYKDSESDEEYLQDDDDELADDEEADDEITKEAAAAILMAGGGPNDPAVPTTEESAQYTKEMILQVDPSSSRIDAVRTLVASPTPELLLPGSTSHTVNSIVICKSTLELPISTTGESEVLQIQPAAATTAKHIIRRRIDAETRR